MTGRSVWWQVVCGAALSVALTGCNDPTAGGDDGSGGTENEGPKLAARPVSGFALDDEVASTSCCSG